LSLRTPAISGATRFPRLNIELNKLAVISQICDGSYMSISSRVSISSESKGTRASDRQKPIIETPIVTRIKESWRPSRGLGPYSIF